MGEGLNHLCPVSLRITLLEDAGIARKRLYLVPPPSHPQGMRTVFGEDNAQLSQLHAQLSMDWADALDKFKVAFRKPGSIQVSRHRLASSSADQSLPGK
ncbi:hypothetical protein DPEC_G00087880 [Dallia pectoralis]|uniref:Uncharacterized protein n=1 Tax=Dallia pectoralis TaxID=75939 RepID=A0ACC2H043_DALPE|nr:hypothetical protein DPEC_G00087880 [Dallia pectoralis]